MKKSIILATLLVLLLWVSIPTQAYTAEEKKAYTYAFNKWITTMNTIDTAMAGPLLRIAMAKMISNYAINVLKLKPDTTKKCKFADVTDERDKQYDYWVTHACQLWIMWIWNDGKIDSKFNPDWTLNKAQLVTILSRILNKAKWKVISNGEPYYKTHLDYLTSIWVADSKRFSPYDYALRKDVMVLIYRSADEKNRLQTTNTSNVKTVNYKEWYTILNPNEWYYNEYYWIWFDYEWKNRWIIIIKWNYLSYWAFVSKKSWNCSIQYFEDELKNDAKKYGSDWYLLVFQSYELLKKWTQDYNSYVEYWKDSNEPTPAMSSKWYSIYAWIDSTIQEAPYSCGWDNSWLSMDQRDHLAWSTMIEEVWNYMSYVK